MHEYICIFAESMHAFTGVVRTRHVQVCMLNRCCGHQRTYLLHARYRMCICVIHIHVYMHICVYIFICMHVCIYICACIYHGMYICIYTSPYAFLQRACMRSQVLLSTMHVQVCTSDRCCEHQRTHLLHARYRMCICAIHIHVYMHMCVYVYVYACIYIYICMYVCTCICV